MHRQIPLPTPNPQFPTMSTQFPPYPYDYIMPQNQAGPSIAMMNSQTQQMAKQELPMTKG